MDICFPDSQRSGDDADALLGLRLPPVLRPLASGHASEVTFPTLPPSRFPVRRLYTVTGSKTLSTTQRAKILRSSERRSVAGFVRHRHNSLELMVAGTRQGVDRFAQTVATVTASTLSDPQPWKGSLFPGFTFDPE